MTNQLSFVTRDAFTIDGYIRELLWKCAHYEHDTDVIQALNEIRTQISDDNVLQVATETVPTVGPPCANPVHESQSSTDAVVAPASAILKSKKKKKSTQQEPQEHSEKVGHEESITESICDKTKKSVLEFSCDKTEEIVSRHFPLEINSRWPVIKHTTISLPVVNHELLRHIFLIGNILRDFVHVDSSYAIGSSVLGVFFDTPYCDIDIVFTDECFQRSHLGKKNISFEKITEFKSTLRKLRSPCGISGKCCGFNYKMTYEPLLEPSLEDKMKSSDNVAVKFYMNIKEISTGNKYRYIVDLSNRKDIQDNWNDYHDFGFTELKLNLTNKHLLIDEMHINSFMQWRLNEPQEHGPNYINRLFALCTNYINDHHQHPHEDHNHALKMGHTAINFAKRLIKAAALRMANLERGIKWNEQCPVCMTSSSDDAQSYMDKMGDVEYKNILEYMLRITKVVCMADSRHFMCLSCVLGTITSNPTKELMCTLCRHPLKDICGDPFCSEPNVSCTMDVKKMLERAQDIGWNIKQWLVEDVTCAKRKPTSKSAMIYCALESLYKPSDQSGSLQRAEAENDGIIGANDMVELDDTYADDVGESSDDD